MLPKDLFSLYLIVDPILCGGHSHSVKLLNAVIPCGVKIVQLRAPNWHKGAILALAKDLLTITRSKGIPLIINDHVDVCLASGADGVHLGANDLPVESARELLGPDAILGYSVNNEKALEHAIRLGHKIDYLGVGPVFPTATKSDHAPPLGIERQRLICSRSIHPTVAVGGINAQNAAEVMAIGAPDALAVISAICAADEPTKTARELCQEIERGRKMKKPMANN
uniref:thiamine phosphate synthase n=1 Tax=Heterodera glycines TaxID=51029 RepID=F1LLP7_HETGL|nr:thiamine phosphate diphosphorylase [Heterodera glycines]